jgi:hypothetical protein
VPAGRAVTVGLSNATAQYWATPDGTGHYTIAGVKPGTYVETIYQDELAVGTQNVTITAGATTAVNITDTYYLPPAIWRIGTHWVSQFVLAPGHASLRSAHDALDEHDLYHRQFHRCQLAHG